MFVKFLNSFKPSESNYLKFNDNKNINKESKQNCDKAFLE
jgi:hypothetical protein